MKIGNKLQFEVPDRCPKDCIYENDFRDYGQSAMCGRCPVFVCEKSAGPEGEPFSLVEPGHYRNDWAAEWERFFKEGGIVVLKFQHPLSDVLKR